MQTQEKEDYQVMRKENDLILSDDDTIFHYTDMRTAMEHILYEKQLRFSKGTKTNDPREYKPWIFSTEFRDKAGSTDHSLSDTKNIAVEVNYKLEKIMKSDYKLACFCSNRSDKGSDSEIDSFLFKKLSLCGYDRLRMWSQYGEAFYGVAIAFSATSLVKRLHEVLGQDALIVSDHVEYADNLYAKDLAISILDGSKLWNENLDMYANEHVKKNIRNIFFAKHIDYSGEIEYRIVVHDPDHKFEYLDITGCVKAVILGDRFPLVYEESIDVLCKELGAENKRSLWFNGKLLVG